MVSEDINIVLKLNTGDFDKGIARASSTLDSFAKGGINQMQALSSNGVSLLGRAFGGLTDIVGKVAIAFTGVGVAAGGAMAASVKTAGDFEQSMSNLQATALATDEEMKRLKQTAIELGASTSFSASEAADAMYYLSSAGFSVNESIGTLPALLNLAASTATDLATTASITTNIMAGFGLSAKDSAEMVDILALTAAKSNTNLIQLGDAFKYVGPVAHALGLSIEETAAAIGILSNAGLDGGKAGTTLRMALSRLVGPTDEAAKLMKQLNIQLYDSSGNLKALPDIVEEFNRALDGMGDAQKVAALATIVGTETASGFLALLAAGSDDLRTFAGDLENAGGTADKMAAIQLDNLKGSLEELSGAIETQAIKLGDRLIPTLRKVIDAFTDLVSEGVDPVFNAFDTLAFVWKNTESPAQTLTAAVAMLLNAFGMDSGKVASLRKDIAAFFAPLDGFKKIAEEFGRALSTALFMLRETGDFKLAATTGLKAFFNSLGLGKEKTEELLGTIEGFLGKVKDGFEKLKDFVTRNKDGIIGALAGVGSAAIIGGFVTLATAIGALLTPLNLFIVSAALFGMAWNTNFLGIKDYDAKVWENLKTSFRDFRTTLEEVRDWYNSDYLPWADGVSQNANSFLYGDDNGDEGAVERYRKQFKEIQDWYNNEYIPWAEGVRQTVSSFWEQYNGNSQIGDRYANQFSGIVEPLRRAIEGMNSGGELSEGLQSGVDNIGTIFYQLSVIIPYYLEEGWTTIREGWDKLVSFIGESFPTIATVLQAVSETIPFFWSLAFDKSFALGEEFGEKFILWAQGLWQSSYDFGQRIAESWRATWNDIALAFEGYKIAIGLAFSSFVGGLNILWSNFVTWIQTRSRNGFEELKTIVAGKLTELSNNTSERLETLKRLFSDAVEKIKGFFNINWSDIGLSIVNGIIAGLLSGLGRLAEAAASLARTAYEAAMAALNANSPSRLFFDVGKNVLGEGFVRGIEAAQGATYRASDSMVQSAYVAATTTPTTKTNNINVPAITINVASADSDTDLEMVARQIYRELQRIM